MNRLSNKAKLVWACGVTFVLGWICLIAVLFRFWPALTDALSATASRPPLETDNELRECFRSHKKEFQEMQAMAVKETKLGEVDIESGMYFNSDGSESCAGRWTWPSTFTKTRTNPNRVKRYSQLLKATGAFYMTIDQSHESVQFLMSRNFTGDKNICWWLKGVPPDYLVLSDTAMGDHVSDHKLLHFCSAIEKNWYIALDEPPQGD